MNSGSRRETISLLETGIRHLVDHLSKLSLKDQVSILAKGGDYAVVDEIGRRLALQPQTVLE